MILVPKADMINHDTNPNTLYYFEENFELVSNQDIKKGEEILSNYGVKSNHDYFFWYGFLEKGNKDNVVCVKAPMLESDKVYEAMLKEGITLNPFFMCSGNIQGLTKLLRWARICTY